jgi:hypothetical protein
MSWRTGRRGIFSLFLGSKLGEDHRKKQPFLVNLLVLKTSSVKNHEAPWLIPVILVTWEAEIGKIEVQSQLRQIVCKIPSPE